MAARVDTGEVGIARGASHDAGKRPLVALGGRWLLTAAALVVFTVTAAAGASAKPIDGNSRAQTQARPAASSKKPNAGATTQATLKGTAVIRWGSDYNRSSGYERFDYVFVTRPHARAAARLPGKAIVYMSGTSVQRDWSTGVTYREALANDWLLKDSTGAYVMNVQFGAFIGDIGNRAYQQRFIDNVSSFLRSTKADGVFIDDVLANPLLLTGGVYPVKYPTAEAWEGATVSFIENVGRALKARGWYVTVNALKFVPGDLRTNTGELTAEFWLRLAPSVSGLTTEYWLQNPNDTSQLRARGQLWYENWDSWLSLASVAQRAGRDFFALTYGSAGDTRAMRYLRASFLLDWDGQGGALIYAPTDNPDPYHPAWVRQLGSATKPKFERAPGVWQRVYEKGVVVVNTTNAPVAVRVGGTMWTIAGTDALMVRPPRN